jgi:hypothetical protein
MKIIISNTRAVEILSAIFIFIFAYTALSKLFDYTSFKALLSQSPLIGKRAGLAAWMLPAVELATSLILFLPSTRSFGFKVTLVLMSLFTGYVAYMLLFEPELPCSCGGVVSAMTWKQHLYFNIALCILSIVGIRMSNKHKLFIAINRSSRTPV